MYEEKNFQEIKEGLDKLSIVIASKLKERKFNDNSTEIQVHFLFFCGIYFSSYFPKYANFFPTNRES
jgi:hypothetical protein